MRSVNRVVAVVGAVLLVASCSSSKKHNAAPSPTAAGPQTYTLQTDMNRADLNLPATEFALAYFPQALSVHPGDTVSVSDNDSGEPHTVALGSLVDAAAAAAAKLTPAQQQGNPPKAVQALLDKVPSMLPNGPGDAFQVAAQPCYLASGVTHGTGACAVHTGDFTGTESLVTSGWLDPNAPFTLKISANAKPGTYNFYCQVHGPSMHGTLTIAPTTTAIPSPDAVKAAGDAAIAKASSQLGGAVATLHALTSKLAFAGAFSQAYQQGGVAAMGPADIHVAVGGVVTWKIFGPHSIYFNAPAAAQGTRVAAPDGSVHLNAAAFAPVGGPPPPQNPGLDNGGAWNGVGPHSSGFLLSFPPALYTYKLKFTKAGTYTYQCTIHPNMKGTVTVA